MAGEQSSQFYNQFLTEMKKAHKEDKIKNGVFGAMMDVSYFNVKKSNKNTNSVYIIVFYNF